jgi:hypothetical protein
MLVRMGLVTAPSTSAAVSTRPEAAGVATPRPSLWSLGALRQVGLIAGFLMAYKVVIVLAGDDVRGEALRHSGYVIDIERWFQIFNEMQVQRWVIDHAEFVIRAFNVYYGSVHFAATAAVLGWLFLRRATAFAAWRNFLAAISGISLLGYWLVPVAPPRMFDGSTQGLPSFQFVDTMAAYPGIWSYKTGAAETLANQYAAMPSLHTGWAIWCGLALFTLGSRRWIRMIGLAHPTITVLGIVITGNHFWLDAIGSFVVIGAAIALCRRPLRASLLAPAAVTGERPRLSGSRSAAGSLA